MLLIWVENIDLLGHVLVLFLLHLLDEVGEVWYRLVVIICLIKVDRVDARRVLGL